MLFLGSKNYQNMPYMKRCVTLLFVALLLMPIKAQLIHVSLDEVTTTAAKTDERIWRITYWLQISTEQTNVIQVCDSFEHASYLDSWFGKNPGLAEVHSTMFCWAFNDDTIWADELFSSDDAECFELSAQAPTTTSIVMDDLYLITYYQQHSDLWPSLNAFGRYFVENASLLYYLEGTYYRAQLPKKLSVTYLSNDYKRIYD